MSSSQHSVSYTSSCKVRTVLLFLPLMLNLILLLTLPFKGTFTSYSIQSLTVFFFQSAYHFFACSPPPHNALDRISVISTNTPFLGHSLYTQHSSYEQLRSHKVTSFSSDLVLKFISTTTTHTHPILTYALS